jgi:hypothetical protein
MMPCMMIIKNHYYFSGRDLTSSRSSRLHGSYSRVGDYAVWLDSAVGTDMRIASCGIDPDTNLQAPFNRADYYVRGLRPAPAVHRDRHSL